VRESRPPGSVRGASSNGCPYRDTTNRRDSPLSRVLAFEDFYSLHFI